MSKKPFKNIGNKETRRQVFDCVASDDMPDGAYFAMANEFGLEPEDLITEKEPTQ